MKLYEHFEQFKIKYCDVDFKDELKPSVLLSLLEDSAGASADELGFGYAYLKPIYCELLRPVNLWDEIVIKTWPLQPSHVIFGREYKVVDSKDVELIKASSRWCLIDMTTGKIAPSKMIDNQDYSTYNANKVFESVQWKIPTFNLEEGELKFTLTIANSEYDHNMHVNNTKYADYCFNCFSVQELANRKLKKFAISYVKQCKEGDILRFYLKATDTNGEYLVHGFNHDNELVVQSRIVFEE